MDLFSGIEVFAKVCETLSFVKAAPRLGMTSSAVGKSIAALEKRLGMRLLNRNTRSLNVTVEGAAYLAHCQRAIAEMETAEGELVHAASVPRGRLRVGMPLVCAPFHPALLSFTRTYPEIELDLDFNDRLVDVVEEGFDVVVRSGKLTDSRLMSRPLGSCRMVLVASAAYLERAGMPATIDELARHQCLRYKSTTTGKLQGWPVPEGASASLPAQLICSHVEMLHYAVLSGAGIACLPDFLIRDDLRGDVLRQVLFDQTANAADFHLLWNQSRSITPKLRAFIDFMVKHLIPSQAIDT